MNTTSTEMPQFVRDLLAAPPRHRDGVHNWIFRLARVMHPYRSENEISQTLCAVLHDCGRAVPDREIQDAIRNSAQCAWQPGVPAGAQTSLRPRWPAANREQIEAAAADGIELVDLWETSPIRLVEGPPQTEGFIDALFPGNPLLCCGRTHKTASTQHRDEWRGKLSNLSFIVPAPMVRKTGRNQSGKETPRCLDNTGVRRFLVIEFDNEPFHRQTALIWHLQVKFLPLVMVVMSGGKSLHAWFHVAGIKDSTLVKFMRTAVALGADPQMWPRCQMSRMPDGLRYEHGKKAKRQGVVFFNPEVIR